MFWLILKRGGLMDRVTLFESINACIPEQDLEFKWLVCDQFRHMGYVI